MCFCSTLSARTSRSTNEPRARPFRTLRLQPRLVGVHRESDFDAAFAAIVTERLEVLFIAADALMLLHGKRVTGNHEAAIALHFMHYNFARLHKTLRVTPTMEAGLAHHVWSWRR